MPANTADFFKQLMKIAAFEVLELGPILDEYLGMEPSEPINEYFETMGLESIHFMNNLGTFTLVIVFKLLLIVIWAVLLLF